MVSSPPKTPESTRSRPKTPASTQSRPKTPASTQSRPKTPGSADTEIGETYDLEKETQAFELEELRKKQEMRMSHLRTPFNYNSPASDGNTLLQVNDQRLPNSRDGYLYDRLGNRVNGAYGDQHPDDVYYDHPIYSLSTFEYDVNGFGLDPNQSNKRKRSPDYQPTKKLRKSVGKTKRRKRR